jgi:hypothetical protein
VYDLVATAGGARTVKAPTLQFTVTGLASSTPYEFRVCAVNELGRGPWSDACAAVATEPLGANVPASRALLTMDQWRLRGGQGDPSLQVVGGGKACDARHRQNKSREATAREESAQ